MRKALLLSIIFFFLAISVLGVVTLPYRSPVNLFNTPLSNVTFTWTAISSLGTLNFPSYLFLTDNGGNATFRHNKTVYCSNNTNCSVFVDALAPGFYQWKILVGENTTRPSVKGTFAEPFAIPPGNNTFNITFSSNLSTENCIVTIGNLSMKPTVQSSLAEPFTTPPGNRTMNFSYTRFGVTQKCLVVFNASFRPTIKSSVAEPFDTTEGNITLNFSYTYNGATYNCLPQMPIGSAIDTVNVTAAINAACNLTAANQSGTVNITGKDYGPFSNITVGGGNATGQFGFTEANTLGSGPNVDTMAISINDSCNMSARNVSGYINLTGLDYGPYANITIGFGNGTEVIGFTEGATSGTGPDVDTIAKNINETCVNISAKNQSGTINLTGLGYGERQTIVIELENATGRLGFSTGTSRGSQQNRSSVASWLEISSQNNYTHFRVVNDSGFEALSLNKNTGDLYLAGGMNWSYLQGYPAACPANSAVSTLADSPTCSDAWMNIDGDNSTGTISHNGTFILVGAGNGDGGCAAANEGEIYYNATSKKHVGCNSTHWNSLY